jgi:membrane protein YdbS with pleckstrin-like domain
MKRVVDPFSNEPIEVGRRPRLRADAFVPVDPRYVWSSVAGLTMTMVVVIAIAVAVVVRSGNTVVPAVIAGGVVLVLAAVVVVLVLEARRLAYQVREHDVSLRSGVIRHRVETIPFARVQHVSVRRGLIERWLGLATLEVSSAGPDISIPGLTVVDADLVRQLVAERAGVEEAVDDDVHRAAPTSPAPWPSP